MRSTRIAMIAPQLNSSIASEELGVSSITSVLRKKDYEVLLTPVTKGIKDYKKIVEFRPDVIGITVYHQTVEFVFEICKDLRKELPDVTICVGGYAPTYYAEEILKEAPFIDYVIRGEGEYAFLDLVNNLSLGKSVKDIKGVGYRGEDNSIILNDKYDYIENLDELPFVSRDLVREGVTTLISTRGCMHNCFFCCGNDFWKKNNKLHWRARSIKNFVDEIEYLYTEEGRNQFWIVDASFEDPGFNEERMKEFAQEIIKRKLTISYSILIRSTFYKKASEELMDLLIKSGLCEVFIGIEAANSHDLKVLGKGVTVDDNIKCIDFFKKYDIYPEIGFINFNPYSTFEGLRENAKFLEEYGYSSFFRQISPVRVYRGSPLYKKLEQDGLLKQCKFYEEDGYSFVDSRIETLSKFLEEYYEYLQTEISVINELLLFERYLGDKLSHITTHLKARGENEAVNLVKEHKQKLYDILSGLNSKVSNWYGRLLDLAENSWDYEMAKSISNTYLDKEYLEQIFSQLRIERIRFGKSLAKVNRELMALIRSTGE